MSVIRMHARALFRSFVFRFSDGSRADRQAESGYRLFSAFLIWTVCHLLLRHFWPDSTRRTWELLAAYGLLAAVLQRFWVAESIEQLGVYAWSRWRLEERYFLFQALMALAIFSSVFLPAATGRLTGAGGSAWMPVVTGLLWGMLQEWIYRGWLQSACQRRLGAAFGLILANVVFTFGPLHFTYFHFGTTTPVAWSSFAAIFAIGALFGWLYHRSGNLLLPALLHGAWVLNMR